MPEPGTATQHHDYDRLAWFYNRYWSNGYHGLALAAIERLALNRIPPAGRVLDLCCGTGHLTAMLTRKGYHVTGLDGSVPMLRFARLNVPGADFAAFDARAFSLRHSFDLVVSTFESMNHMQNLTELCRVFDNTREALGKAGWFVFDVLREAAYRANWHKSMSIVEDDNVCILRGGYDEASKLGRAFITMFRRERAWERSDVTIVERCYTNQEIVDSLHRAGFRTMREYDATTELALPGDLATGRSFYVAGC